MLKTQDTRPQSWQNCDKDIKNFVNNLILKLDMHLGDNLVGVYLHGSLAMGSYYRPKSDIDLIVVIENKLGVDERKSISGMLVKHESLKPNIGSIELTIVLAKTAKEIPVPIPFELHYSTEWHDRILAGQVDYEVERTDPDLQSHFTYVIHRGVVLRGRPIDDVFGKIDWQSFIDGVINDFDWIIKDENILEAPFYGVLNICRVLQLFTENSHQVHSKDEGGQWALRNLPERYHAIVSQALDAYHSPKQINEKIQKTNGEIWDKEALLSLREYAAKIVSMDRID